MLEGVIYKPVIDVEKCGACGVCLRQCPAELLRELRKGEESLRGLAYKYLETAQSLDRVPDSPPCQLKCPINQDIRGYVRLVAEEKYEEALELIRETNALPSVTGYVCHRPCESTCLRDSVEGPVAIRALKRFVADFDDSRLVPLQVGQNKGQKVTIVGSGPSGLAAAYDLTRDGFQVEIIEASSQPGGMLRWAIPSFRLPRKILDRDISYIQKMGVTIKTGIKLGAGVTLADLRNDGTDAVILAIGTQQGLKMGVENETSLSGYMDCLTFLRDYASGRQVALERKAIVIGGGNAAIDTARVALRCGVKEVKIFYRRSYEEMPADKDEIAEAQAEGVGIIYLSAPVRIIEKDGVVRGVEFIKTKLAQRDKSGRRSPVPIKGSEFVEKANSVISAVGQQADLSWNQNGLSFKLSPGNTFMVNDSCMTNIEGIFAAGDAVNGPTTIVEAMASGKKAASSAALYLSKERR